MDEEERKKIQGFDAALLSGKADKLRGCNSEVSIQTPDGMKNILYRKVHTDLSRHDMNIPYDESIIGPAVEVHLAHGNVKDQEEFLLRIPHCLQIKDLSAVKVRCINDKTPDSVQNVPTKQQAMGKIPYFETDSSHVTIHTDHFSEYVCSGSSDKCLTSIIAFPFGRLWWSENMSHVKVILYLCCSLYKIQDFRIVSNKCSFPFHVNTYQEF